MKINDYSIIATDYAKSDNSGTAFLAFKDIPSIIHQYATGKKVLDYGCGSGNSSLFLKELALEVEGVDISQEMIDEAQKNDPTIPFRKIDSGLLPYPDNEFDIVFSSFVLFEISSFDEMTRILNEIYRVLKKDGIFIFITGSETLYSRNWLSLDVDFPENKNLKSGDIAKVLLKDVNLVVLDYFWTNQDYDHVINQTKFQKIKTLFPIGSDEDGYPWLDEKYYPPYSIYVLKK